MVDMTDSMDTTRIIQEVQPNEIYNLAGSMELMKEYKLRLAIIVYHVYENVLERQDAIVKSYILFA